MTLALFSLSAAPAGAQSRQGQGQSQGQPASMSRPASATTGTANPDNMPIKRPRHPPRDRMSHDHPGSDALAK
jgi:hypothetical protein